MSKGTTMTVIDTNVIEARYDELLLMPMQDLLVEIDCTQWGLSVVDALAFPTEEELVKHLLMTEFGAEAIDVAKAWDETAPLYSHRRGGRFYQGA
jgi:hypothetical protein